MSTPVHFIGRCSAKGCKTTVRLTATARIGNGTNRYGTPQTLPAFIFACRVAKIDPAGGTNQFGHPAVLDPDTHGWNIEERPYALTSAHDYDVLPMCIAHRRVLRFVRIDGHQVDTIRCDARCEGAKGPNCECSCGGHNHGGKWAA